jgi:glycoprotein 6-alpha-L-fucosyltransferase
LASIRNLTSVDGYQSWREREHKSLSRLMQARLNSLQNPLKPCTDVKRISCNINKGCGYGCEIHHAMHCFHIAYALGRPMFLFSEGWRYNPPGFHEIFQSLSQNCTKSMFSNPSSWGKLKFILLLKKNELLKFL